MRGFGSSKSLIVIAVIIFGFLILYSILPRGESSKNLPIGSVISMAERGEILRIDVNGNNLSIVTKNNETFTSRKESGVSLYEMLSVRGVEAGKDVEISVVQSGNLLSSLLSLFPLIFLLYFMFVLMQRSSRGQGADWVGGLGRSKAKRFPAEEVPSVKFEDVAGAEEPKQELAEIVEFLKSPERFQSMGAKIPKGVLLIGPPGTGKTLISRAVAGEAGVPFFSTSGSEFVEMFVGVGAARVRDLFFRAKANAPAIVFIDEIDAVGRHRGSGLGGGHDEREQTLNQMLTEMDGFNSFTNVIVIAATNRPDILDPALLRPGRFDRRVIMPLPDLKGREQILQVHAKGKPISPSVDLRIIARRTHGFSGADLANVMNEAAILAARKSKTLIEAEDFGEAVDRVIAGPAMKSRKTSEKEREITAYHEAGHAVVAHNMDGADPVHKITIIPRGIAGGYTQQIPEEDRSYWSMKQLKITLAVLMAGQIAERLVFNDVTTGSSNDLERATNIARDMVIKYGMSSLGPISFGGGQDVVFLGKEFANGPSYSEAVAEKIDNEINLIIRQAEFEARTILEKYRKKLEYLAKKVLAVEILEGEELQQVLSSDM
ncbi:MAG: cell division protein FtsH [Candidatus Spechtbacteria bacterium RIFCSPHIGHO2_02_FULL_43_15b]|uniref:ATP-dependent zinc metalloprotease FtsH n=1 Tax=Candidatus Spechtbacteria bacterium RIFCSPHIGHO2_01_FULL_43_30 TaxID=1802158 RepID=A0A1G2H810_9BACT|nr:MAG: cell division protein FtsH [Candidatus Spechtbacteria bacterium RIFCSPHIGHO2_01_FULL_43_30]OGZ59099.1 MAG: cell division protein FtsH [Candidatus Spechtbacteria bacterium RIFCSPHIGHO2_02_FULL_43_15b]